MVLGLNSDLLYAIHELCQQAVSAAASPHLELSLPGDFFLFCFKDSVFLSCPGQV